LRKGPVKDQGEEDSSLYPFLGLCISPSEKKSGTTGSLLCKFIIEYGAVYILFQP